MILKGKQICQWQALEGPIRIAGRWVVFLLQELEEAKRLAEQKAAAGDDLMKAEVSPRGSQNVIYDVHCVG